MKNISIVENFLCHTSSDVCHDNSVVYLLSLFKSSLPLHMRPFFDLKLSQNSIFSSLATTNNVLTDSCLYPDQFEYFIEKLCAHLQIPHSHASDQLEPLLETIIRAAHSLCQERDLCSTQLCEWQQRCDTSAREYALLQQELATVRSRLVDTETKYSQLLTACDNNSNTLSALHDQMATLQIHNKQLLEDKCRVQSQLANLEISIEDVQAAKRADDGKHAAAASEWNRCRQDLETRLHALQQDMSEALAGRQETIVELERLRAELGRCQCERTELIEAVNSKHGESVRYHGEMTRLAAEHERCTAEAAELRRARDEALSTCSQSRAKCDLALLNVQDLRQRNSQLSTENREMQETRTYLSQEAERLRAHLSTVEEQHTQQQLLAGSRLADLEEQLARLQLEVSHTHSLREQLSVCTEERDECRAQMLQAAQSSRNLQRVLDRFQTEQQSRIDEAVVHVQCDTVQLRSALERSQNELILANKKLQQFDSICEKQKVSENTILVLKNDVMQKQSQIEKLTIEFDTYKSSSSGQIDKDLARNLLVGYISASDDYQRRTILRTIAQCLHFDTTDCHRVGLQSPQDSGSAFSTSGSYLYETAGGGSGGGVSLGEAFLRFLQQESVTHSPVVVDARQMALQAVEKMNAAVHGKHSATDVAMVSGENLKQFSTE